MTRFPRRPRIQWETQLQLMLEKYPHSSGRITGHSELTWQADIRPSELSETYRVEVRGKPYSFPHVWVSGRGIDCCKDLSVVPHKFGKEEKPNRIQICLQKGDWNAWLPLAETLVPWAMEWLVQYEIWLCTGTWNGSGIHPKESHANKRGPNHRAASMKVKPRLT